MKRAEKIFLPSSVGERHEARGRGTDLGYWKVLTKILAFFSKFDEFRLYSIISDYKIINTHPQIKQYQVNKTDTQINNIVHSGIPVSRIYS